MHFRIAKNLACLVFCCVSIANARADGALKDSVPHVSVIGSANLEVAPDIAFLSLGVSTERPTAAEALSENARAVQTLLDDIKAQGIDARDFKTISVTLSPVYDFSADPVSHTTSQKLRAYKARNIVEVRFRDFGKAGKLASQWVGKGANELEGLRFDIEHPDAAHDKLRGDAMLDALHRAQSYVTATKLKLGRVIEITADEVPQESGPVFSTREFHSASSAPTPVAIPVEPGTQNLHTTVKVTWELVP